jgi:hypothetical protein
MKRPVDTFSYGEDKDEDYDAKVGNLLQGTTLRWHGILPSKSLYFYFWTPRDLIYKIKPCPIF